jgi:hypothetical protein
MNRAQVVVASLSVAKTPIGFESAIIESFTLFPMLSWSSASKAFATGERHIARKRKGAFVSESALHFDGDKPCQRDRNEGLQNRETFCCARARFFLSLGHVDFARPRSSLAA